MKAPRIKILDGFRALAIISVILFHFFSKKDYQASYYPYKNHYDYFRFGYLGVEFFFMISGFVISQTLTTTGNFFEFWKKRLIRLFPSILLSSITIFTIFSFIADLSLFPGARMPVNFIPSLTFISPGVFNTFFLKYTHIKLDYLNGSFWSLWPEIQFYFLASIIYFFNQHRFLTNFTFISFSIVGIHWLMGNISGSNVMHISLPSSISNDYKLGVDEMFNLPSYLVFFCVGVFFYNLYRLKKNMEHPSIYKKIIYSIFLFYMLYSGVQWEVRLCFLIMIILFLLFIYFPATVSVFSGKVLVNIGFASYFIYLIHEPIGVMLIHKYAIINAPLDIIITAAIIFLILYSGYWYTIHIDKRMNRALKKLLIPQIKPGEKLTGPK